MYLIKNVEVYSPKYMGKKDILISDKIEMIQDHIDTDLFEIIDGSSLKAVPGFIDGHVHITGGGGEGSFHTKAPEITLSKITGNGITTVLGLLGTDGLSRSVENLLSKVKALKEEGISCYGLSGSYQYPPVTITGDIKSDIMFIDEIIGCKLALSDHRSTHITTQELIKLASDVRVSAMLSGKPGIIVLHMGNEESELDQVFEALEQTDIPITLFHPTHVTRDPKLLAQSIELVKRGGYMDITGSHFESAYQAIKRMWDENIDTSHVTISSDGQGSWSNYDEYGNLIAIGVQSVDCLFKLFLYMLDQGVAMEKALTFFTSNVADSLKLSNKGKIEEGKDADLLLLDADHKIKDVIAMGKFHVLDYQQIIKGTYE